jgi:flagellar hook-associated protein 2
MASFDPVSMASQLAAAYTQPAQSLLTSQKTAAQQTSTALSTLKSALSTFDSALASLSSSSGLRQFSATLSTDGIATASANSRAQAGTYSFFVEQLATAQQIAFEDLPAVPVALGGPLTVQLADGSSFNVDLIAADTDNDGSISQSEIARAINQANGNGGKVTASLVSTSSGTQLLLNSGETGASQAITLDTSALPAGALKDALDAGRELVPARDAIVWLGGQGGVKLEQASNTFTSIQGVTVTFTRAMAPSEPLLTLNVAPDASGTADNVRKFVEAYNALQKSLGELTKKGNVEAGTKSAVFASDASLRALRDRLTSVLRQDFGGLSLVDLGIRASRDGVLSLDQDKLDRTLAAKPDALETVFGKASLTSNSGVLGAMNGYIDLWLNSTSGQIARRQASVQQQQKTLTDRQARLDIQYDNVFQRYLKQFTQLQALEAQMGQTSSLFGTLALG